MGKGRGEGTNSRYYSVGASFQHTKHAGTRGSGGHTPPPGKILKINAKMFQCKEIST